MNGRGKTETKRGKPLVRKSERPTQQVDSLFSSADPDSLSVDWKASIEGGSHAVYAREYKGAVSRLLVA